MLCNKQPCFKSVAKWLHCATWCTHYMELNPDGAEEFAQRTTSGGIITIAAVATMLILFVSELRECQGHVMGSMG